MKRKLQKRIFVILLLGFMPFVDSVSGLIGVSFNQIYRVGVFLFFGYEAMMNSEKKMRILLGIFCAYVLLSQVLTDISHMVSNISASLKLFTPIFISIALFQNLSKNKILEEDIVSIFYMWAIVYPCSLLGAYLFGQGRTTYSSGAGFKGLFFSTNEISFVFSSIVMFLISYLAVNKKVSLVHYVLIILNGLVVFILGTKSLYAVMGVFTVFLLAKMFFGKDALKGKKEKIILLSTLGVGGLIIIIFFRSSVQSIINRWIWQRTYNSGSLLDFLTSGRVLRIGNGFKAFFNQFSNIILGWGLDGMNVGHINIEMDFFDLLFGGGIVTTFCVVAIYILLWKNICKKTFWVYAIWIVAFGSSFLGGHVLFCGQSGMAMAILIVYANGISQSKENVQIE